jgi:aryl-alcohol dehydrogenase-like predicted oxidoreductase
MPQLPACFKQWSPLWARWRQWLDAHRVQPTSACLAYPLSLSQVSNVVIGVDSPGQFAELLAASRALPPADELPDLRCIDERLINPSLWNTL